MLLNCGSGGDSWESLGLQRDQTSSSWRKSVLNIHWKEWCWSWSSNTLATLCKELTHWKDPDVGKDWRQEEKGTTEDEMVGWHHWLDGHEFEQALGVGDGQGSLVRCGPWVTKSRTRLREWNELRPWRQWETNCKRFELKEVLFSKNLLRFKSGWEGYSWGIITKHTS